MTLSLRPFEESDIHHKIRWINDPQNNKYLHYDLPLEYEKTAAWFRRVRNDRGRLDLVIEYKRAPIGLIGLLSMDRLNRRAEYYITMGEQVYHRRGIARDASVLLLGMAFGELGLHLVYLYTEEDNTPAQRLFERIGFRRDGCLRDELYKNGKFVSRYLYSMIEDEYHELYK